MAVAYRCRRHYCRRNDLESAAEEVFCRDCGQIMFSPMAGSKVCSDQYCDHCWRLWSKNNRTRFLDESLCMPARYRGATVRDFQGQTVHILQVGLGTFGTFVKPDVRWMRVLLEAPAKGSDCPPSEEDLLGIGVDCLEESAGFQEELALTRQGCSVFLAAMDSSAGERTLWCLPRGTRIEVRNVMRQNGVDLKTRAAVDWELAYLENMSNVGEEIHLDTNTTLQRVQELLSSDFNGRLIEKRTVPCYTYRDVLREHNAAGCEIFVVDAEGMDCAIVGSMIDACSAGHSSWPTLVCYETRGVPGSSDRNYTNDEEMTMSRLEDAGYVVLQLGLDATLVHGPTLKESSALCAWADRHFFLSCYVCSCQVLPSHWTFAEQVGRGSRQWQGTEKDQAFMKRHSNPWMLASGTWCCSMCLKQRGILNNNATTS